MGKKRITDFPEITEEEMQGSINLVESGDGAGTRHIKFEKLAEAIGRLLKLGDMEKLKTKEKTSFVGALNEVNEKTETVFTGTDGIKAGTAGLVPAPQPEDEGKVLSTKGWVNSAAGGGGSDSKGRLKTIEEIEANTEEGYDVDALPIKEMIVRSGGVQWIVDEDSGQVTGYKTKVGADTVFPFLSSFNNLTQIYYKNFTKGKTSSAQPTEGSWMVEEQYYGKRALVFMASTLATTSAPGSFSYTGLEDEKILLQKDDITYISARILMGILKEGSFKATIPLTSTETSIIIAVYILD